MKFNLYQSAKEKMLIVAHRGVSGGNIPCNTLAAYEIALKQGADMIEIDVDMTSDGKLVIFHPGMEKAHLYNPNRIKNLTYEEVKRLRFVNYDDVPTQFGLSTFDEILETFKDRCYINVDKFWGHPVEISEAIRRHGMKDQILVKSAPSAKVLETLKETAPDIAFMPIIREDGGIHETMMNSGVNYVGCEILFFSDESPLISETFLGKLKKDEKIAWGNTIIYDHKEQIAAGHSDDTSLLGHPENGWGWMADKGFDIIQTDWTLMAIDYLKSVGKYYR